MESPKDFSNRREYRFDIETYECKGLEIENYKGYSACVPDDVYGWNSIGDVLSLDEVHSVTVVEKCFWWRWFWPGYLDCGDWNTAETAKKMIEQIEDELNLEYDPATQTFYEMEETE